MCKWKLTRNNKKVEINQENVDKALEQVKQEKWPQEGQPVFMLLSTGYIDNPQYQRNFHKEQLAQGNIARTREELEIKRDVRRAQHRIREYIRKNFGGPWTGADWENYSQPKWIICYNYVTRKFDAVCCTSIQYSLSADHFPTREQAEQLARDCEAELRIVRG